MTGTREVIVLGSTGSIGTQALQIAASNPDRFRITGLAAGGRDAGLLVRQVAETRARIVAVRDESAANEVARACPEVEVIPGPGAAAELAGRPTDVVLNGMSGAAGLLPTVAALGGGAILALANKESLIIGGPVVKAMARPGQVVPVDSEHSALAQALRSGSHTEVSRLILTASGGPFRGMTTDQLSGVTPEQALAHPTWEMGPLVTVNSATLVNKGLELIEAHLLFDIGFDRLDVVVHPQSVVHSMVEFVDGSTIVQASPPDMRLPISLGMGWPERVPGAITPCDWTGATSWTFEPVDHSTFPAIGLAADVGSAGGVLPAIFNAADEVAVAAFLSRHVGFPGIVETIQSVVADYDGRFDRNELTVGDVLAADDWARARAREILGTREA